jgi:DNA-binding PadR family transcriptional regulator
MAPERLHENEKVLEMGIEQEIIEFLETSPRRRDDIADHIGVSRTTLYPILQDMERNGLIDSNIESSNGRGRPGILWGISSKGNDMDYWKECFEKEMRILRVLKHKALTVKQLKIRDISVKSREFLLLMNLREIEKRRIRNDEHKRSRLNIYGLPDKKEEYWGKSKRYVRINE